MAEPVAVEATAPVVAVAAASELPLELYETTADPTVERTAAMTAMKRVPVAMDSRIDCFPQPDLGGSFSGGANGKDSSFETER